MIKMALDLSNSADLALAMDRRTAGVSPTLGPTESRRRLKEVRQDVVDKLQTRRRVDELERLRHAPRKRSSPPKQTWPPTASSLLAPSLSTVHGGSIAGPQQSERYSRLNFNFPSALLPRKNRAKKPQADPEDDEETRAIAQHMLDAYVANGTEPLVTMLEPFDDIDLSSEDEYDPSCGLPYCPRLNIDRRRVDAVLMISGTLAQLEIERQAAEKVAMYHRTRVIPWLFVHAMKQVAAEIRSVGAVKKSMERAELGPAPHGFCYVQVEDRVYLIADDGDGSMVYIAEASAVIVCSRP
ncbi:hypothetical protein FB451DRAFT_717148 [Mycena latifolia]|nr:hypothetical protein FB451DRAFT_124931 [Mycena latifolia]KAJ7450907.1 hypothetical protein FB451DRAFT_717148 [Mycena latifolia]